MITGLERRATILERIKVDKTPVSGTALARECQVSRQVIVQDIALIRASGYDIISTNRGYILNEPHRVSRIFKVKHNDANLENELCSIVDLGGFVKNVMVNHKVYGQIEADLRISSRRKAMEFMDEIKSGKSSPLKNLTADYHYHTVEAENEETLDLIETTLRENGYLVENTGIA